MHISEAESRVMAVLWERGAATAEDVIGDLADQSDWQEATIKTLLNRLLKKGAIAAQSEGRRYRYRPLLAQADWMQQESSSLLDRLFGGRIAPLVAHFSERGKLTRRDVDELRKLIREFDDAK
jgi:BlaI family penicillinase repressor